MKEKVGRKEDSVLNNELEWKQAQRDSRKVGKVWVGIGRYPERGTQGG